MKKLKQLTRLLGVLAVIMAFFGTQEVWGQTNTWDGSTDNDWSDPDNWSLNLVPIPAHDVVIDINTNTPTVPAGITLNSLELSGLFAGTLNLAGALTLTADLDIQTGTLATAGYDLSVGTTTDIATGASLTSNGGTKVFTGDVDLAGATAILTLGGTTTATLTVISANISGLTTNSNVNLTLTNAGIITYSAGQITAVDDLTLNGAGLSLTLGGVLNVNGGLTISNGTLAAAGNTLTVTGTTTLSGGTSLTASTGTLTLGTIDNSGTVQTTGAATVNLNGGVTAIGTLTLNAATNLAFGGSTAVTLTLPAAVANLATLVINNSNAAITLGVGLTTTGVVTVSAGSLATGAFTSSFGGVVTNSAGATLNMTGSTITFNDDINGTGTYTTTGSSITLDGSNAITLPSTLNSFVTLIINRDAAGNTVTLGATTAVTTTFTNTQGTLDLGGFSFTIPNAYAGNGNFTLNATASTVIFSSTADFSAGTFTTTAGTTVTFNGAVTALTGGGARNLLSATFTNASATLANGLTLAGSLSLTGTTVLTTAGVAVSVGTTTGIGVGTQFVSTGGTKTFTGAVTVTGSLDLTGTTTILGTSIAGAGTVTTTATTLVTCNGATDFTLPNDFATLGRLTISGGATITLEGDLTVGDGVDANDDLVISNGSLDLDDNNITLAEANAEIAETAGSFVINNGTGGGYIATAATIPAADIIASEIGVTAITGGNYTVYRYPQPATVGTYQSVDRVYRIVGTAPATLTLQFDNDESTSLTIADLVLISGNNVDLAVSYNHGTTNRTVTENPGTAKSTVGYTGLTNHGGEYFSLFAASSVAGDTITCVATGNWNAGGTWDGGIVPTSTDIVLIPSGFTVTVNADAECKHLVIDDASLIVSATRRLEISGNLSLTGTSSFTAANATSSVVAFLGATTQTIAVAEDSYLEFGLLEVSLNTTVNTATNFTVKSYMDVATGSTFNATAGTATFNISGLGGNSVLWNSNSGTLSLYDVLILTAGGANAIPATNITVKGNFTKLGAGNLAPTAGTITFTNTNLAGKEIQVVGGTDSFWNLAISAGSKVKTSSTFSIISTAAGAMTLGASATFNSEAGTITFSGGTAATIVNPATGTLEFNNLVISAATGTASSFTVKGNLTTTAALTASAGTITFTNNLPKTISASTIQFNNLAVSNGSDVVTATAFSVIGNFTVGTNAAFTATAGAITFDGGTTKTITNNDSLVFFNLIIGDVASNVVQTATDFIVANNMTYPTVVNNPSFNATAGTVKFKASTPTITTSGNNPMSFYNLELAGGTVTLAASQILAIKKDLMLNKVGVNNGTLAAADATPTVRFIGSENSLITGTSVAAIPATFGVLVINKSANTNELALELNTAVYNAGTLTFTKGILNLGSKTFTNGATTITLTDGGINGGTGTYVISTGHTTPFLTNTLFTTEGGTNTLYNLDVLIAHVMGAGNLTVNGDFDFTGAVDFTISASQTLEIKGNVLVTAAGTFEAADAGSSVLKLSGSGTCEILEDALFGTTYPSITFDRGETLTGDLTLIALNVLTLNTSTQFLNLDGNTLDLDAAATIQLIRKSGGIDASTSGSTVVLNTHASMVTIPANLFKNNEVDVLTLGNAEYILAGDLIILSDLNQATVNNLYTKNNTLTIGPDVDLTSGIPGWVAADHVVGNLKMTVTSTLTTFNLGDGTANGFRPISMKFKTSGSSQVVSLTTQKVNPTLGRGGNPQRAINVIWSITPIGTAPSDSMWIDFGWGSDYDNGLTVNANTSFPAKWSTTLWSDYRDGYGQTASATGFIAGSELSPKASTYPVYASALSGNWAVFVAAGNTTADKDNAIKTTNAKLGITSVSPNPIGAGLPFKVTIQLQDRYGNPTANTGTTPIQIGIGNLIGTITAPVASIAVGANSVIVNGFIYATAGSGYQFKAFKTSGGPTYTIDTAVSPLVYVMNSLPSDQIYDITLGGGQTSTTLGFDIANDGFGVILAKAGSAITSSDFPVDGTTYYGSTIYGQGSTINDAVVVYAGAVDATEANNTVTITGLAAGTTYHFRGFAYNGSNGNEKYLTFSSANNPKSFTTTTNIDDDVVYGSNNTMAEAKPIGTNTPLYGTIKSDTDEDWFSFTVTNGSPNLRTKLTLSANLGNYNIEVYNLDGRRVRRGTRLNNNNEAQVVNDLEPGTYIVRLYGVSGAYSTTLPYTLLLTTKGSEIYSVTE